MDVGRAVFSDLRIFIAGRYSLQFISDGMVSYTFPIRVLALPAKTFLILRQPPAVADAGKVLTAMPILNLVDKYNNTIMLDPDVAQDPTQEIFWETTVTLVLCPRGSSSGRMSSSTSQIESAAGLE